MKKNVWKRMASLLVMVCIFVCGAMHVFAAGSDVTVTYEDLGNGFAVKTITYTEGGDGARTVRAEKREQQFTYNGTWIATISLTAIFQYNGQTCKALSASGEHSVASGWLYYNENVSVGGATATLTATLAKNNAGYVPIAINLSCDKDGNVY